MRNMQNVFIYMLYININDRACSKGSLFLVFILAPSNRVKRHLRGECTKPQRCPARLNRETLNSKWDINVHCQLPRSRAPARGEQLTVYWRRIADGGSHRLPAASPRHTDESPRYSAVPRSIRNSRFSPGSSAETNIARTASTRRTMGIT